MRSSRAILLVTNLTAVLVLGASASLLAATLSGYWHYTVDDAFISFRYAEHWARGDGLSWNPGGAPQEGYTSVLHVGLLALTAKLGAPLEVTSKVMGVAGMVVALLIAAVIAQRQSGGSFLTSLAAVAAGAAALAHVFPVHAVAGLETTLFAALWMALALAADDELPSPRRARLIAALSLGLGLCRPEGNLVAGVTWAALLLTTRGPERRRLALTALGVYLAPAALYFAWRWQRYGLPMPLPFYVKVSGGSGFQGAEIARDFLGAIPLVIAGLTLLGSAHLTLAGPRWRALRLLLPAAAFFTFFLWPEHVMGFDFRFYSPMVPLVLALTAAGLAMASRAGRWTAPVLLLAFSCSQLPWRDLHAQEAWARSRFEGYALGLDSAHRRLGAALVAAGREWPRPAPLLAIGDCGVVPYVSDWRTLDTFGLNDSELARLRPPRGAAYVERVFAAEPDVLVLISSTAEAFKPPLPWEELLYTGALERGFVVMGKVAFASNYSLWVLARADPAGQRVLETALLSAR